MLSPSTLESEDMEAVVLDEMRDLSKIRFLLLTVQKMTALFIHSIK